MKRRADWVGWSLQFTLGFFVGVGASLVPFARMQRFRFDGQRLALWMLGAGLLGGALAAYFGDRLWLGSKRYVPNADAPQHSPASCMACVVIGTLGTVLMLFAVGPKLAR